MPKTFDARTALPTVATSLTIYKEGSITIYTAKLTATYTGEIDFYLSADGGSNWESVTPNVTHTFTNTGTELRWKAVGKYPAQLTVLKVKYNL